MAERSASERHHLDLAEVTARELLHHVSDVVTQHVATIAGQPVAPSQATLEPVRDHLAGYDFERERPGLQVVTDVFRWLANGDVQTSHPRYFGLFNPAPTWPAVAADLLTASLNPQLAAYSHAPAAVEVERAVLRFIAARLGMPDQTHGTFTSGGAEANHTATIIALTERIAGYGEDGLSRAGPRPVFYASAESHLAWLKIAHACGLGRKAVRLVPVDPYDHRLDLAALEEIYRSDLAKGFAPFMIVGTAGTTAGGAIDPLPQLADFARAQNLHFHVDAAWAGAVALSDLLRPLIAGIERADSVTVDAHKWLSVPMGAGMIMVADPDAPGRAFHVSTTYMPVTDLGRSDPYTTSMQWSRRLIGLKLFTSLSVFGRAGHASQIEHDVDLGRYIRHQAEHRNWLSINTSPLPVVCLADPVTDQGDATESLSWHSKVTELVTAAGTAWVSPVRVAGRAGIRVCVTSYRSTRDDVDALFNALDDARRQMTPDPPRGQVRCY